MSQNELSKVDTIALLQSVARIETKLQDDGGPKPKSWIEIITAFGVMIATVFGIYTIVLGWGKDNIEIAKGPFEIEQAQLDVEKTRLEIEGLVAELNAQKASGLQQNDAAALALIDQINTSVDALAAASSAPQSTEVLLIFVFIFASFWAIGIAQDTTKVVWQFLTLVVLTITRRIVRRKNGKLIRFGHFISVAVPFAVSQLPDLFFLFLKLTLFATVIVPFLYSIAQLTPLAEQLDMFVNSMMDYKMLDALRSLADAVSPGSSGSS